MLRSPGTRGNEFIINLTFRRKKHFFCVIFLLDVVGGGIENKGSGTLTVEHLMIPRSDTIDNLIVNAQLFLFFTLFETFVFL